MRRTVMGIGGSVAILAGILVAWIGDLAHAAKVSDVRASKHNLSAAAAGTPTSGGRTVPSRTVQATSETQVCVFCHTPHGATQRDQSGNTVRTPLWNRKIPDNATYTVYTSSTLDANVIQGQLDQPGGTSKLCLSCHDGTLAIGQVNVLNGAGSQTTPGTVNINMTGTGSGGIMPGSTTTGFTRNLGVDLSNDHPISVSYTGDLARRDGELRIVNDATQSWPGTSGNQTIGVRSSGIRHKLPLERTGSGGAGFDGQIQCGSCHDPHLVDTDTSKGNQKFLRLNRFQEAITANVNTATYNTGDSGDIICLACHDKNVDGGIWTYSAHANSNVATQTYTSGAASTREFPNALPVWKAACMNCHDTHTIPGARRLLREGTDGSGTPKSGGSPALEETCYQCHDGSTTVLNSVTTVPNIKSDFTTAGNKRMPITSAAQPAGEEVHDINANYEDPTFIDCTGTTSKCGKDFLEPRSKLGVTSLNNRHVECTDCHNPHRVLKKKQGVPGTLSTNALNGDNAGTHRHDEATGYTHNNLISGVLRGAWGVEPGYPSNSFHSMPDTFTVKRGDPGNDTCTDPATCLASDKTYVTREYQICFKCHSNYGYSDNNVYPSGNRPLLVTYTNGTPSGTNSLTMFTNQAKEFQSPSSHAAGSNTINLGTDAGSAGGFNNRNHRSWHPVVRATGRDASARSLTANSAFRSPWNNAVGTQTMYCSDCHGSSTGTRLSVVPDSTPTTNDDGTGSPWGPHGSSNNFILKGTWDNETNINTGTALCLKCHSPTSSTGFGIAGDGGGRDNLHQYHNDKTGPIECTWCHVAVPHGWKNRSFLVNLNDVGEEAGQGVGSSKEVSINASNQNYTQEPYYIQAKVKIVTFASPGNWGAGNCGSAGKSGTGLTTGRINNSQGGSANLTGTGKDWMTDTCQNPP